VMEELSRHFDGSPGSIFGTVVEKLGDQVDRVQWSHLIPAFKG